MVNFAEYKERKRQQALQKSQSTSAPPPQQPVKNAPPTTPSPPPVDKMEDKPVPTNQRINSAKESLPLPTKPPKQQRPNETLQKSQASVPKKEEDVKPTWNELQLFIKSYKTSKKLPPILMPDLPLIYRETKPKPQPEPQPQPRPQPTKSTPANPPAYAKIPRMLSPTLPARYINHDDIRQPTPKRTATNLGVIESKVKSNNTTSPPQANFTRRYGDHILKLVNTEHDKKLLLKLRFKPHKQQKKVIGLGIQNVKPSTVSSRMVRRIPVEDENRSPQKRPPSSSSSTTTTTTTTTQEKTTFLHRSNSDARSERGNASPERISPPPRSKNPGHSVESLSQSSEKLILTAKTAKKKGDALHSTDLTSALVHYIDCITIYIIAFNHEEQAKKLDGKQPNEKRWTSILNFIDYTLNLIDKSETYDHMKGLLNQTKSVICTHSCMLLDEVIETKQKRKDSLIEKKAPLEELQILGNSLNVDVRNHIRHFKLAREAQEIGEAKLSIWCVRTQYRELYDIYKNQERNRVRNDDGVIDLDKAGLYLPINSSVTLEEITKYSLLILKTWCRDKGVKYQSENGW